MMQRLATTCVFVGLFGTPGPSQGLDILVPSGSNDGAFALVDKNSDGVYSVAAGECWDYMLADVDTSPRNFVRLNDTFYYPDGELDGIYSMRDANGNGKIESSEVKVFYSFAAAFGNSYVTHIALDASGWIWSANSIGTGEGVFRHRDLNSDGDAEDPGETIGVLTEAMPRVTIANTPVTTATAPPLLTAGGLQQIAWDPTYGNGRFLVEEEDFDQTICLEDKNGDGDFADADECYLFCALFDLGPLAADLNPDVTAGLLPSCKEIRGILVDPVSKVYFLMSSEADAQSPDAGLILRGQDKNADGDINDAGEVTVFWDGSLDSTGANAGYNFFVGLSLGGTGKLYVCAEFDGLPDRERLVLIQDRNNDRDANDVGEVTVLWELPVDRAHFRPGVFPRGTLKSLVGATALAEIDNYAAATCPTSLSVTSVHRIQAGVSSPTSGGSSRPPVLLNTKWTVRTSGAAPSSPGAYGIGLVKLPSGFKFNANCRIYSTLDLILLHFTTDASGMHDTIQPLPNMRSLLGLATYWQSIVVDAGAPSGGGLTFSDPMTVKYGNWSYTK